MKNKPDGIRFTTWNTTKIDLDIVFQLRRFDPNDKTFIEINPYDLFCKLNISRNDTVLRHEFTRLVKDAPRMSDMNSDMKNRFAKVWYKCEQYYEIGSEYIVKSMSLDDAILKINDYKMDIMLSTSK